MTVGISVDTKGEHGNAKLNISNIRLNISPDIVELIIALQASVLGPLMQPSVEKPVATCSSFLKVSVHACLPATMHWAAIGSSMLMSKFPPYRWNQQHRHQQG